MVSLQKKLAQEWSSEFTEACCNKIAPIATSDVSVSNKIGVGGGGQMLEDQNCADLSF